MSRTQQPESSGIRFWRPSAQPPGETRPIDAPKTRKTRKSEILQEWRDFDPTGKVVQKEGVAISTDIPEELFVKVESIIITTYRTGPIEDIRTQARFFSKAVYDWLTPVIEKQGKMFDPVLGLPRAKSSLRETMPKDQRHRVIVYFAPFLAGQMKGMIMEAQTKTKGINSVATVWELFTDAGTTLADRLIKDHDIVVSETARRRRD